MKKVIAILLLLFWVIPFVFTQKDSVTDERDNLLYKYERVVEKVPDNKREVMVVFTFSNGKEPRAITYRQEKIFSNLEWVKKGKGLVIQEPIVEKITINLLPWEVVEWRFLIQSNTKKRKTVVEKSALLLMNEQFEVTKIVFDEMSFPR